MKNSQYCDMYTPNPNMGFRTELHLRNQLEFFCVLRNESLCSNSYPCPVRLPFFPMFLYLKVLFLLLPLWIEINM